jgi:hypothetical protein
MAMNGGGRTIVAGAIGLALVLGAGMASAEVAVDTCELTVVIGAPQDARPWGSVEVLVTSASESPGLRLLRHQEALGARHGRGSAAE